MIAERHPWLVKSSQWDERKHPRDKGKFSSSQGARGSEKPKTDIRHNPDLDAVFAEPAQANPQAKPSGDLRRNTALDEFMGIEGWNSPSKPDPAKVASDAAAKIGQQFAMGKPHKVKDFVAALRQHPPDVIQAICAKAGIVKTDTPRDVVGKFYKAFGGKVKVSFPGKNGQGKQQARQPQQSSSPKTIDVANAIKASGGDHGKAFDSIRQQISQHIASGGRASMYVDGKHVNIAKIDQNRVFDDKGQQWGLMPLAMGTPGKKNGIELHPPSGKGPSKRQLPPLPSKREPPPLPSQRGRREPPPLPRRRKGVHPWLVKRAQWEESKHPRDHGRFSSKPGARGSTKSAGDSLKSTKQSADGIEDKYAAQARKIVGGKIKEVKERAWTGQQTGAPISKDIAGAVGEEIVIQYLKSIGYDDAGHTSSLVGTAMNNLPFDLIHDHQLIEVKGGQVGSGEGIWALKYDGRFTKEQEAKFARMTPEKVKLAKKKINQAKVKAIHDRKKAFVDRLSKELGFKIKPGMMTVIIDHERKIADIYQFDQLHDRINWKSELAQNGYVTSVRYG